MIRVRADKIARFHRLEMLVLRSETLDAKKPTGSDVFFKYCSMLESIAKQNLGDVPSEWNDPVLEDDYMAVRIKLIHSLTVVSPLVRPEQTDADYQRRMEVMAAFLNSMKTAKL